MKIDKARFGFIDYYVFGSMRRLPVEFFDSVVGTMAWLDGEMVEKRLQVIVTSEMNPIIIGDFAKVMERFNNEARELFKNSRMWKECIQNNSGLLLLFAAMNEMSTKNISASQAIEEALQACVDLRESEMAVVGEIAGMFATADFFQTPSKQITVLPPSEVRSSPQFTFA